MTNAIISPRSTIFDNHTNVVHDISQTGETSDILQCEGADPASGNRFADNVHNAMQVTKHNNIIHDTCQIGEENVTSVQTRLRTNQEDTSIQGVTSVKNVETCTVQMTSHIDQIHDNFQAEASTSLCVDISLQSDYSDIPQCDGADTVSNSSLNHSISNIQVPNYSINNIPVVTSVARPPAQQVPMTTRVLTAINRNERVHTSATFPVIAVANVCSFLPKLNSTIEKIMMEEISVLLLNEVWEKTGRKNRHFQEKMQEMLELHGLKYISCGSRPSGKRGGGAAIIVNTSKFTLEKLDIHIPHNLEVQWGLVRPREVTQNTKFKEYIFGSFYSPPPAERTRSFWTT